MKVVFCVPVMLCMVLAGPARADLAFHIDGRVTEISGSAQSNLAGLGVHMDAPVSIDWSVDPNAPFTDNPPTFSRLYSSGAITSFTVKIGSWTATGSDARATVNLVQVGHGQGADTTDDLHLTRSAVDTPDDFLTGNDPNGQISLNFDDFHGKGNTGLGLDQQTPSQFSSMVGAVSGVNGMVQFGPAPAGAKSNAKCDAARLTAAGALCKATLACMAKNAKLALADPNQTLEGCLVTPEERFTTAYDAAAAAAARKKLSCGNDLTATEMLTVFDTAIDPVVGVAGTISPPNVLVVSAWYAAAGAMCSAAEKAEAKNASNPSPTKLAQARAAASAKLTTAANKVITKAEHQGVVFTPPPDVAKFLDSIDTLIDDLAKAVKGT